MGEGERYEEIYSLLLTIWTAESSVYKEINRANQYRDESMIETLGPLACLMTSALICKMKECNPRKLFAKKYTEEEYLKHMNEEQKMTVYRGIGLPESAVEDYRERLRSGEK